MGATVDSQDTTRLIVPEGDAESPGAGEAGHPTAARRRTAAGFRPPILSHGEPIYRSGDPRARALLQYCSEVCGKKRDSKRLKKALTMVREVRNLEPNNALVLPFLFPSAGFGGAQQPSFTESRRRLDRPTNPSRRNRKRQTSALFGSRFLTSRTIVSAFLRR